MMILYAMYSVTFRAAVVDGRSPHEHDITLRVSEKDLPTYLTVLVQNGVGVFTCAREASPADG